MRQRINITLPKETVQLIDRVAKKGDRSRVIDLAVRQFVTSRSKANLRKQLKEGYTRWAEHDRELAETWFPLDEEAWQTVK
jgi:CopG family transcriptional regulator/antitoxin EndoAI